jgi:hypothetical protein
MGGLGLRRLDVMNTACIGKLGWKMQSNSNDFWCNMIRGKYSRDIVQQSRVVKASDSSLWKALKNIMPLIEKVSMCLAAFWQVHQSVVE